MFFEFNLLSELHTPDLLMDTSRIEIISVDPGRKALGAIYSDVGRSILKTTTKVVCPERTVKKSSKSDLNLLLPTRAPGVFRYASFMFLFRMVFGCLLILSGCLIITGNLPAPESPLTSMQYAHLEIIAGISIISGFATRFSAAALSLLFTAVAIESIPTGLFDMQSVMSLLCSMTLCIAGSGRYSVDQIIKKSLINRALNRRKQLREDRLSYKAAVCESDDILSER